MARYAVTLTRQITQTATFIVEAENVGRAMVEAENAPWQSATITSSADNFGAEDEWQHESVTELPHPARSVRHRPAVATGCDEKRQPLRQP